MKNAEREESPFLFCAVRCTEAPPLPGSLRPGPAAAWHSGRARLHSPHWLLYCL